MNAHSVTVVVFENDDWCFSTKHTDLDIAGAVPITYYLGYTYPDIEAVYESLSKRGKLRFNPIKELEPAFSVYYLDRMV